MTEHIEITRARLSQFEGADWGAILAAVASGLGVTYLLVTAGRAIGFSADDGVKLEETTIMAVGAWTIVASMLGMVVGGLVGGRFARWLTRGSALYHGLTAWGAMLLLTSFLGTTGADGLLGTGLLNVVAAAQDEPTVILLNGWAVAIGMALTLLATIGGWYLGGRAGLTAAERPDVMTSHETLEREPSRRPQGV